MLSRFASGAAAVAVLSFAIDTRPRRGASSLVTIGFIGGWDIGDSGDIPPRWIIRGPATKSGGFAGVALNPRDGEIYGVGAGFNGFLRYLVPQFFEVPTTTNGR